MDDPPAPDRHRQRGLHPARDEWERAEALLAAYREATESGRGAAMFEGEMIDEANRRMAGAGGRVAQPATPLRRRPDGAAAALSSVKQKP